MFEFNKSTKFKTAFASSIEAIKSDLCNIGNSYLAICYQVWEIDTNKSYTKAGYKNTCEALEKEVGFKKSTVYNMIKVVKTYGADEHGHISFNHLYSHNKFSFSQLVEMLSLGSEQREKVTPETPVSAIRMLKKSDNAASLEASEKPEEFQTSGKSLPVVRSENLEIVSCTANFAGKELSSQYSIGVESGNLFCSFAPTFFNQLDALVDTLGFLCDDVDPKSNSVFCGANFMEYDPDTLEDIFAFIMGVYRSAYNSYKKQQDLIDKSAV